MPIARNLLVATDFSDPSRRGLEMAAALGRRTGAKITVCHVLDPAPLAPYATGPDYGARLLQEQGVEKAIHEGLTEIVERHFEGIASTKTALILSASPAEGICNYAKKEGADLIVLATEGRTGLAHALIGSVAEKVVRHAPCPVLTVRVDPNAKE